MLWASESGGQSKEGKLKMMIRCDMCGMYEGEKKEHLSECQQTCSCVTEWQLTVTFELFLQPADLARPCFLGDGLYLLGPGSYLEAGTPSGINNLHAGEERLLRSLYLIMTM